MKLFKGVGTASGNEEMERGTVFSRESPMPLNVSQHFISFVPIS